MHPIRAARAVSVALAIMLLAGLAAPTLVTPTLAAPGLGEAGAPASSVAPIPPPDLATALVSVKAGAPVEAPVEAPAPRLPACQYRDDLTRFGQPSDWDKTLLDTNLRLRRSYEPWDLVSVSRAGVAGSGQVRRLIVADLAAMAAAARKAGKPLAVRSAYRSYATQVATFASWVARSGYQQALKFSARPGHSEHQLGTTVDFTTAPGAPLSGTFGTSPAGQWLARNGWRFGFIMSYPEGMRRVSCYGYEPWHWRYVGRDLARQIFESGQVPRRFFWENVESA